MRKFFIIRETVPFEHYRIFWKTNNRYFTLVRDAVGHIMLNTTRIGEPAFNRLLEEYNKEAHR